MRALLVVVAVLMGLYGCTTSVLAPVDGRGVYSGGYYTVAKGDTLYSIAWRHGVDFRSVARWNRIEPPYLIRPGQRLRLTAPPTQTAVASAPPKQTASKPTPTATTTRKTSPPSARNAGSSIAWRWPVEGEVTRRFTANGNGKQGVEISGRTGQPVVAAASGRVVYAGDGLRGYGNLVIIKHDTRYLTAYGYNDSLLVKEGDVVKAGQRIATMGRGPGRSSPAVHFELRRDGKAVDPLSYLPRR